MHYLYVLQSQSDNNIYIGCTKDLKKRIVMHNSGKVSSTRKRKPLKLIYYEAFINQQDAYNKEQWLKTGWGRNYLKRTLRNYLKN